MWWSEAVTKHQFLMSWECELADTLHLNHNTNIINTRSPTVLINTTKTMFTYNSNNNNIHVEYPFWLENVKLQTAEAKQANEPLARNTSGHDCPLRMTLLASVFHFQSKLVDIINWLSGYHAKTYHFFTFSFRMRRGEDVYDVKA